MNEAFFAELSAWLMQAGLAGTSETDIVSGFCERFVAAGLPLARTTVLIDTLHPVHEGRLFRWGLGPTESPLLEYGRTRPDGLAATGFDPKDVEAAERWRHSLFYRMLQTGDTLLRRDNTRTASNRRCHCSLRLCNRYTRPNATWSCRRLSSHSIGIERWRP